MLRLEGDVRMGDAMDDVLIADSTVRGRSAALPMTLIASSACP